MSGHLTVQGADLLRGTVETVRRDGHTTVLLDLQDLQAADGAALQVLRSLRQPVAADGGELFVSPSPRGLTPRI